MSKAETKDDFSDMSRTELIRYVRDSDEAPPPERLQTMSDAQLRGIARQVQAELLAYSGLKPRERR